MNRYKKKTVALILASVISIAGSFADSNYKNTLMDISFSSSSNGSINMVLETKQPYSGNVTPIKQDANTYVLLLPEINSQAPTPNLSSGLLNIKSVNIRTMPYSGNNNGYTKIVIKTETPLALTGANKVFVPTQEYNQRLLENNGKNDIKNNANKTSKEEAQYYQEHYAKKAPATETINYAASKERTTTRQAQSTVRQVRPVEYSPSDNTKQTKPSTTKTTIQEDEQAPETTQKEFNQNNDNSSKDSNYEAFLWVCAILLIFVLIIYFVVRAQNKMQTLAGESFEVDLDSEKKENKNKNINKIKTEINRLDKAYTNNPKSRFENYRQDFSNDSMHIEKVDVVDLDEMFKEKKENTMPTQEENISINELESDDFDFLNYLADTGEEELEEEQFNETLYSSILDNPNLKFGQDDIEKINILINNEISEEIYKNLNDFLKNNKNVKTHVKLNKRESLISSYQEQNIVFNDADIVILDKLINVEIDKDFAKSLATDKNKTAQMEKDILNPAIKRPPLIDKVLNVKDMLPNLSLELRKQGNRKIESDRKPEVIYSESGYDVQVLSSEDLPNITIEIKNNKYDEYKASADYEYQAEGFENKTLNVDGMLPDLDDVLKHPQKYEDRKPKTKPSERDLFNSIKNVQFKPFYEDEMIDLSEKFEKKDFENISNDFESIFTDNPIVLDSDNKESGTEEITGEIIEVQPPQFEENNIENIQKDVPENIISDNKIIKILSTAEIDSQKGCHLIKDDNGYSVIGYVGNTTYDLKSFEELKSEKIQIRQNRNSADTDVTQYIVRIGLNKFIIEYKDGQLKYIMDLC